MHLEYEDFFIEFPNKLINRKRQCRFISHNILLIVRHKNKVSLKM